MSRQIAGMKQLAFQHQSEGKCNVTHDEAYLTAYAFLNQFWEDRRGDFDDDLPVLLGAMTLLDDGQSADPAQWFDWLACLPEDEQVTLEQVNNGLHCFLEQYRQRGEGGAQDISRFLEWMSTSSEATWHLLKESAQVVIDNPDLRHTLASTHPMNAFTLTQEASKR